MTSRSRIAGLVGGIIQAGARGHEDRSALSRRALRRGASQTNAAEHQEQTVRRSAWRRRATPQARLTHQSWQRWRPRDRARILRLAPPGLLLPAHYPRGPRASAVRGPSLRAAFPALRDRARAHDHTDRAESPPLSSRASARAARPAQHDHVQAMLASTIALLRSGGRWHNTCGKPAMLYPRYARHTRTATSPRCMRARRPVYAPLHSSSAGTWRR